MTNQVLRRTRGHVVGASGHVYAYAAPPTHRNHRGRPISRATWIAYQLAEIGSYVGGVALVMLVIIEIMAVPR